MRLEFQLKDYLKKRHVKLRGLATRIERETGNAIQRKTVEKYLNGTRTTLDLRHLRILFNWIRQVRLDDGLPHEIFGFRPSSLVAALIAPGRVTTYQGVYRRDGAEPVEPYWASSDDSFVASTIVELLSHPMASTAPGRRKATPVQFDQIRVPHTISGNGGALDAKGIADEKRAALKVLRQVQVPPVPASPVIIGSPRANPLTEAYGAQLWPELKLRPFTPAPGVAPFHLRFRSQSAPSCLGGTDAPPGADLADAYGIYYRHAGAWHVAPSVPGRRDAGIVIVRRCPSEAITELLLFGFSGVATAALGQLLRSEADRFWPQEPDIVAEPARSVWTYLCRFDLKKSDERLTDPGAPHVENAEVILLDGTR